MKTADCYGCKYLRLPLCVAGFTGRSGWDTWYICQRNDPHRPVRLIKKCDMAHDMAHAVKQEKGSVVKLTKKYKSDLQKALRCAKSGRAYHWPTIADILAKEIQRQEEQIKELNSDSENGC